MAHDIFNTAKFHAAYGFAEEIPQSILNEVAIVGKSNVGKSTLINTICNNKNLAKTSSKPGKTTTINYFQMPNFFIVDLPGYGYSTTSKKDRLRWSNLIDEYFNLNRNYSLVISLIDIRHLPSQLDCQMIAYLESLNLKYAIVFTKSDKLSKQQANNQKTKINKQLKLNASIPTIACSANTGQGISELKSLILDSVK